jgi:hypothetical protein
LTSEILVNASGGFDDYEIEGGWSEEGILWKVDVAKDGHLAI